MYTEIKYPDAKSQTSYQDGLEFQDYVIDLLIQHLGLSLSNYSSRKWQYTIGENRQGIEIKLDRRIIETGNVSIELAEKTKASNFEYVPSGIMRDDNTWLYIQGNYEIIFIFAKQTLRLLNTSNRYKIDNLPTIKRFLLPLKDAEKYAAKIIR